MAPRRHLAPTEQVQQPGRSHQQGGQQQRRAVEQMASNRPWANAGMGKPRLMVIASRGEKASAWFGWSQAWRYLQQRNTDEQGEGGDEVNARRDLGNELLPLVQRPGERDRRQK